MLLHPQGGPGTVWARNAEVGDEIAIGMPASKITLDQRAGYHVFLGDENGAVPLLAMRAGLAPEVAVYGAFQAFDHRFRVPAPAGVAALPWVEQPHPSGRTTFAALDAARALELPPGAGCAYVAGEANLCKAVFRHFVEERRWPRAAVKTQPQWAAGRTGFGVGHRIGDGRWCRANGGPAAARMTAGESSRLNRRLRSAASEGRRASRT